MDDADPAAREAPSRVTLQQLADSLDLSTATVSLALRNAPMVADATRARVLEAARVRGYVANRSAASLRTARSQIVGVVFHDVTNPYFAEMLASIEDVALASGRTLLLGTYQEDLGRYARVLETLREHRPDGVIVCAAGGSSAADLEALALSRIAVAQASREVTDAGFDFVGTDDVKSARLAVDHLIQLGHRRIAMLGGVEPTSTGRRRRRGYREALAAAGLPYDPALVFEGYAKHEVGFAGVQQALDVADPPTAAFCFNDLVAFGAMQGLRFRGREAGRDFAVAGVDDVAHAALWYPPLTTVRSRQGEIGRIAAELLLKRIADPGRPVARVTLEPTLVVRASTCPPAG